MATLMNLIAEINGVKSEADAKTLMKRYIDEKELVNQFGMTWITSCSTTAEFVALYLINKKITREDMFQGKEEGLEALPGEKGKLCVCWCEPHPSESLGHNLIVAREGNVSALLHGWDKKWSIFPKLNPPAPRPYNFYGALMGKMIKELLTNGDPNFHIHTEDVKFPKSWVVRVLKF
jgi:hypothetical protein